MGKSRKSEQAVRFEPKGFGLRLMDEIQNEGIVHYEIVAQLEAITGRNLVAYTSFAEHPAGIIADPDDRLIETILQSVDLSKYPGTLDLMINSPGGSPTAAEKIVLTCRAYAASFRVLVPQTAMSAATMIAMGADSIVMPDTAELGPIDPQMVQQLPGGRAILRPAKAFIDAYLELINKTQEAIKNNQPPHPYLELLRKIDPPWVQVCVKARELAKKIAIEFLSKWMLNGKHQDEIVAVVDRFLAEGEEGSHGRAIRPEKAVSLGLKKVERIEKNSELWKVVWELHERCQQYVRSRGFAKYLVARSGGINVRVQQLQVS